MATEEQLTPAQVQAETEEAVAAGAAAIEAEPDPAKRKPAASKAIREVAETKRIKLSQEEADMIADALIARFAQRGTFDPPPEPVTPASSIPEPNATGAPVATQAGQPVPEPPRKKTFAERFRGA